MFNWRTILFWTGIAIVVLFVIKHPDQAGGLVHKAGNALSQAASGLSTFVSSI
jgi:hypothetical protein